MSPSLNGSNFFHQTYTFSIEDQSQIGEARRFANVLCDKLKFAITKQGQVSIVVNEMATNLLKYSKKGQLLIRVMDRGTNSGIEITSVDSGPGIESIPRAMVDGFSTGSSPGTGLGAIKRQSDEFDIYSVLGQGTIVFSTIYMNENSNPSNYNIGAVSVPMKGETVSGDAWCISEAKDQLQIMMVDGLGHGPLAHQAAVEAIDEFKKGISYTLPLAFNAIHNRLRGTRGGAIQICRWNGFSNIEYASAGNIRAVVQSNEKIKTLVSQNGTAGLRVTSLKVYNHEWAGDGFLILHSDGINSRWDLSKYPGIVNCHAAVIAAVIYRDFNRGNDDATVLVVRGLK